MPSRRTIGFLVEVQSSMSVKEIASYLKNVYIPCTHVKQVSRGQVMQAPKKRGKKHVKANRRTNRR